MNHSSLVLEQGIDKDNCLKKILEKVFPFSTILDLIVWVIYEDLLDFRIYHIVIIFLVGLN